MSWRLRWLVLAPVVLFVAGTLLMSSCGGGGSGCEGSFDEFGNFVAGLCPSPGAEPGFSLSTIVIGEGPEPASTPTPVPSRTIVGAKTPVITATPVSTLVASAAPTAIIIGQQLDFVASGNFVKNKQSVVEDITNRSSTLWASTDPDVLAPPQPPPLGGIYTGISAGCACADVSSGGISADPVSVGVASVPMPGATPVCPICPTIEATPTSTPKAQAPAADQADQVEQPRSDRARINGILQWTWQGVSPVASRLVPSNDGNLYFVTRDGFLHALDAKGNQRFSRVVTGAGIAVSPEGILYALAPGGILQAISAKGKPQWALTGVAGNGPLAASSNAVYFQQDGQLIAVSAPGAVQWRASATDPISTAAITDDGTIIAASNGASVVAFSAAGGRRWSFTPEGGFAGEIAVRGEIVYVGSAQGHVYALDEASGAAQWTYDTASAVGAGPVLNPSGPIFFGSDAIYALNSDGSLAWSKTLAKPLVSPLASDGEGGVFAPLDGDISAMLNSDGGLKWATRSFGPVERATVSGVGTLYVTSNGVVYAVK
jgi:outer membrane protein assembly factor BamB